MSGNGGLIKLKMMKTVFQLLAFIQVSLLGCAQGTYEEKLESLYKGSVELVKVDSLPPGAVLIDAREKELSLLNMMISNRQILPIFRKIKKSLFIVQWAIVVNA